MHFLIEKLILMRVIAQEIFGVQYIFSCASHILRDVFRIHLMMIICSFVHSSSCTISSRPKSLNYHDSLHLYHYHQNSLMCSRQWNSQQWKTLDICIINIPCIYPICLFMLTFISKLGCYFCHRTYIVKYFISFNLLFLALCFSACSLIIHTILGSSLTT